MESSKSHPVNRRSRIRFFSASREWSRLASRLLLTKLGERYHKECGTSLAGERTSGAHNEVGCVQYISQHHGESMPGVILAFDLNCQNEQQLTLIAE